MAISSASSITDIENAYLDNSDYEAQGSVVKCQAFLQACRALILRRPGESRRSARGSNFSVQFDMQIIKQQMDEARQWLAFAPAAQTDGGVTFPSFLEARDYDSGFSGGAARQQPYGDQ